jgi:outer membrane receptor protein involved in Fe transport
MMAEKVLSRSVRLMFAGGMAFAMSHAGAQEAASAAPQMQRVEVTGSRIPMANLEGTSPITVVTAQEIKMDGLRSVENLLNNLPQVFADQGGTISNGASGTATVNLRNFGADRTLVLVNGRRLPAGSPSNTAADLNQIPAPLIKRVEVLTGGASAVYGSDAVAGVVNFIMNDTFSGAQIEVNQSFYNHKQHGGNPAAAVAESNYPLPGNAGSDGRIRDASLLLGGNFADNKGNATVFVSWKKEDAMLQSQRDFSSCSLEGMTDGSTFHCGGSSTSFPGRFILGDNSSVTVANAQGGVRPWTTADLYNYGPTNYYQRPAESYAFSSFIHYNVNENTRLYAEASFHDNRTVAQIAPSGIFGLTFPIAYENPLLSNAWRQTLGLNAPGDVTDVYVMRRNVEGGGRQDDLRHTSYRGVLGLKGDIGKWNYDVYAQLGRVLFQENYVNDFSNARIARAMDVVTGANGTPVCRSFLDGSDPSCVPYNIWSLGGVTPDALGYLQTPGFQKGFTSQSVMGVNFGTDLGEYGLRLPTASAGVAFNVGFEHRTEKLERKVDTAFATGDLAGQGGPTNSVGGEYSVKDYFAEARIPLLSRLPFADDVSLNVSYRNSRYSTGYNTNSFGSGLEWGMNSLVKLRASYQKAVRAANIVEMFTPSGLGLYDNDEDPCAGTSPSATPEQCARTGVTAAQYGKILDNPAAQYNGLFGGNANLKPETSKSYTFGLVLTPLRNLSLTLDYFNMKVKDVIGAMPPTTTLSDCLDSGNAASCSMIHRGANGSLWMDNGAYILANNMNLGMRKTSGVDVAANYRQKLTGGMGNLDVNLTGTWLKEFLQEDAPGMGTYDCAGLFGPSCGTPLPTWRHKLRGTWSTPWAVDLALTWRFIDEVKLSATSSNRLLAGGFEPGDATFGRRNYLDFAANWKVNQMFVVRGGINNLFDKDPPVGGVTSSVYGNGNTFPQVYDAFGRRVFLNLAATF